MLSILTKILTLFGVKKEIDKNKVCQTWEELQKHLKQQLEILETSVNIFDSGNETEAKHIATIIRLLLHDTNNSKSLLKLLNLKKIEFYDSLLDLNKGAIKTYEGLVVKFMGGGITKYYPVLDEFNDKIKKSKFDNYWNNTIIIDQNNNKFSRKDIVLNIANSDGGAHVGLYLNKDYKQLTKENSLGWIDENNPNNFPFKNIEFVSIRQIAHEVLKTLIPNYPIHKLPNNISGSFFII